jgi:chaperonin GroES
MLAAFPNHCVKAPSRYWIAPLNLNHCWKYSGEYSDDTTGTAGLNPAGPPGDNYQTHAASLMEHAWREDRGDTGIMKVKPLGDKLIVKRSEVADRTESGIYLPESAKDKPREGKIVAVGNGNLNRDTGEYLPFTVKKGDRVIFSSYAGTEIKIEGSDYLIMTEDDILGTIDS